MFVFADGLAQQPGLDLARGRPPGGRRRPARRTAQQGGDGRILPGCRIQARLGHVTS